MDEWFDGIEEDFSLFKVAGSKFIAMCNTWVVKGGSFPDDIQLECMLQKDAHKHGPAALPIEASGEVKLTTLYKVLKTKPSETDQSGEQQSDSIAVKFDLLWQPNTTRTFVFVSPRMREGALPAWIEANKTSPKRIHVLLVAALSSLADLEKAKCAHQDAKCDNFVVSDHGHTATSIDFELAVSQSHRNENNAFIPGFNFARSYSTDLHRSDTATLYLSFAAHLDNSVWFRRKYDGVMLNGFEPDRAKKGFATYINRTEAKWINIPTPLNALDALKGLDDGVN